jgi:hypothetical protein
MNAMEALEIILHQKESKHIEPCIALLPEIQNQCGYNPLNELRQLWKDKEIRSHRTLNTLAFSIYENRQRDL